MTELPRRYPSPEGHEPVGEVRVLGGGRAVLVEFLEDVDGQPLGTETISLRWVGTNPDNPCVGGYVRASNLEGNNS